MNNSLDKLEKWKTRAYMGIALVALCLIVGVVLYVFGILWQAVATIIITAIIAFMLHGAVNYLEERGLSRLVSTIIALLIFLVLIVGCFALFVPAIVEQVAAFSSEAPHYLTQVRDFIDQNKHLLPIDESTVSSLLDQATAFIREQSGTILQTAAGGILVGVTSVSNALLIFFIALICAFWVLVDLPTMSREVMSLFSEEQAKTVRVVTGAFNTAVYGWMKATLICAVINGVINGFAYWIMGLPYFALLGLLCCLLYIIPYIGPAVSAVVVALVGLLVSPAAAIAALAINLVVTNIIASVLSPRLMRSSVSVHPAVSLIVILIGGALGGIVGMLFSIPVAAAIQGVFVTFFEERTGKQLATEDGALFHKPKMKQVPTRRKRERKSKTNPEKHQ